MLEEHDGCVFAVICLIFLIGSWAHFGYLGYKDGCKKGEEIGYLKACKDIAEGKSKAELRTLPGGEKKWFLKTEKEVKDAD